METTPKFVGKGRKALVRGILEHINTFTNAEGGDNKACWISLEAPSGWGKTRIAQEVYAELAKRQSVRYWPERLHESFRLDRGSIIGRSKSVFPAPSSFDREKGALPAYFWWGLECIVNQANEPVEIFENILEQLTLHSPFLEAAWAAQKAVGLEKYATVRAAHAAFTEILDEGASAILTKSAEMIGANVPGLGLVVSLGKFGFGVAKKKSKQKSAINTMGELPGPSDSYKIMDEIIGLVSRLATPALPVIIFVEDLHRATKNVQAFLAKLIRTNSPILILSTTWPSEFEKIKTISQINEEPTFKDRILRIQYDKPAPTSFPKEASLGPLPATALSEIIYNYYPKAEAETVDRLINRYQTPLPLELVLSLDINTSDHPYLEIDEEDIVNLPEDIRDLYRALWNELPKPVQRALSAATLAMPDEDPIFLAPLVGKVLSKIERFDDSLPYIANDNYPHGWVRHVEAWLRKFGDPIQLEIANQGRKSFFKKRTEEKFLKTLAEELSETDFESAEIGNAELGHKAWLLLSLYSTTFIDHEKYLDTISYLIKGILERPTNLNSFKKISALLELTSVVKLDVSKPMVALKIINLNVGRYRNYYNFGSYQRALDGFDALVNAYEEFDVVTKKKHNVSSFIAIVYGCRLFRAKCLLKLGKLDGAINEFKQLLEINVYGIAPHKVTKQLSKHPQVRLELARAYGEQNRPRDALKILDELVYDATETYGNGGKLTLEVREARAEQNALLGHIEIARQEYAILIPLMYELYGDNDSQTLITKANYQSLVHSKYDIGAAVNNLWELHDHVIKSDEFGYGLTYIKIFERLVNAEEMAEQTEAAITSRKSLIQCYDSFMWQELPVYVENLWKLSSLLCIDESYVDAIEYGKKALEIIEKKYEKKNLKFFQAQNKHANLLANAGQIKTSLSLYLELLEGCLKNLGATHSETELALKNMNDCLLKIDDVNQVVQYKKEVIGLYDRSLGKTHEKTLFVQNELAYIYNTNHLFDEAAQLYKSLLDDYRIVHGGENYETQRVHQNYAKSLASTGQIDAAIKEFTKLIPLQTRSFGGVEAATYDSRSQLATNLVRIENFNEAYRVSKSLLEDLLPSYDSKDPKVLSTRHNMALCLFYLEDFTEAKTLFDENIPLQQEIYGEGHESTLIASLYNLMIVIDDGPTSETEHQLEALVEKIGRFLGAEHQFSIMGQQVLSHIREEPED